jgi:hypothetical protein
LHLCTTKIRASLPQKGGSNCVDQTIQPNRAHGADDHIPRHIVLGFWSYPLWLRRCPYSTLRPVFQTASMCRIDFRGGRGGEIRRHADAGLIYFGLFLCESNRMRIKHGQVTHYACIWDGKCTGRTYPCLRRGDVLPRRVVVVVSRRVSGDRGVKIVGTNREHCENSA